MGRARLPLAVLDEARRESGTGSSAVRLTGPAGCGRPRQTSSPGESTGQESALPLTTDGTYI